MYNFERISRNFIQKVEKYFKNIDVIDVNEDLLKDHRQKNSLYEGLQVHKKMF